MTQTPQRSTFVTVLAWIFIVLSGFGTFISILQNIMLFTVFRRPEVVQAMNTPPPGTPPVMALLTSHVHWFFLGFLGITLFTLACSIGLLRRLNWARLGFVAIMLLGIAWNLGGVALQLVTFSSMQQQFASAATKEGVNMQAFFIAMAVMSVLFAAAFSALYGWIAKRLLSPAIAAEFQQRP